MPAVCVDSQLIISPTERAGRWLLLPLLLLGRELLWSCLPPLHQDGENSGCMEGGLTLQSDLENGMPHNERDKGNLKTRIYFLSPLNPWDLKLSALSHPFPRHRVVRGAWRCPVCVTTALQQLGLSDVEHPKGAHGLPLAVPSKRSSLHLYGTTFHLCGAEDPPR